MFYSLAVFSLFSLLIGVKSEPEVACSLSGKIDLQLIVDSSGSVGKNNFKLMLQEVADDLIGQFDIGKDKTRVSLFKYSSPEVMKEEFELDAYTDAGSLKKAIKAIKYEAGWTNTGLAMEKALAHYSAKMRTEKDTAKVCIVLTDGKATDAAKIPAALKAWGNKGVTVFAMGIGKNIKDAGLEVITGSKDQVIKVADFNAIGKAANSLLAKVCKAIPTKPVMIATNGIVGGTKCAYKDHIPKNAFRQGDYWFCPSREKHPQYIWMKFCAPHRIIQLGIQTASFAPSVKRFDIIGSSDCAAPWTVLRHVEDAGFSKFGQKKVWTVPVQNRRAFSCIGLKIETSNEHPFPYIMVEQIQMWE